MEEKRRADPMMWVFWFGVVAIAAVILMGILGPPFGLRIGPGPGSGRTLTAVKALEMAVGHFEVEYGRLPEVGSHAFDCDDAEGRSLAEILLGREEDERRAQNPRKIPFLSIETAKSAAKGGLLYGKGSEVLGIYDAWGEPFQILLRKPGERGITLVHRGKTVIIERPVVVFSKGKDKIAGTRDDVRTWE
jgi:hypothetical protein